MFDSETADEPILYVKPHVALRKTSATTGWNSKISTERSQNFCKVLGGNVFFPYLRTVTQLPVSENIRFYGSNIPFHL
jgi:hypothetical protein